MRIAKSFFGQTKKITDLAQARERKKAVSALLNDDDRLERALKRVFIEEMRRKREKLEAGRCMSEEEFEVFEQSLLDLAERMNLDITSDIQGATGIITLVAPRFDLSRDKEPELVEAFSRALAGSDRLFFNVLPDYDEPRIHLTLLFDLDL